MRRKFFAWQKILVRSFHLFIVLFVTGNLLIKDNTGIFFIRKFLLFYIFYFYYLYF